MSQENQEAFARLIIALRVAGSRGREVARAVELAVRAREEMSEAFRGRPDPLLAQGLRHALCRIAETTPCSVTTTCDSPGLDGLSESTEEAALAVCREGIANALKHGSARSIGISVAREGDWLGVIVRDDGIGCTGTGGGTGLAGLRRRVGAIGGRVIILGAPGSGTTLAAHLPVAGAGGPPTVDRRLHDTVQQSLVALALELAAMRDDDPDDIIVARCVQLVRELLAFVRRSADVARRAVS